ncbi:hypothetical protein B566_EDAN017544, partial [Ephemera danica]
MKRRLALRKKKGKSAESDVSDYEESDVSDYEESLETVTQPKQLQQELHTPKRAWTLGNKNIAFENKMIYVGENKYRSTPGLYELIFAAEPDHSIVTEHDKDVYRNILSHTSAHKRGYTEMQGLLPSKSYKYDLCLYSKAKQTSMPDLRPLTGPAPVVLRPFAGIHNPFPKGCSVLCNHPAENLGADRRAFYARASQDIYFKDGARASFLAAPAPTDDWVPEELFRKYTETDS